MFGLAEIVHDQKIRVLEARWTTILAVCRDVVDGPKEITARDLAHQILMASQAQDVAVEAVVIARAQWVEDHNEPTSDEAKADLDAHLTAVAHHAAGMIIDTPTPALKETP